MLNCSQVVLWLVLGVALLKQTLQFRIGWQSVGDSISLQSADNYVVASILAMLHFLHSTGVRQPA